MKRWRIVWKIWRKKVGEKIRVLIAKFHKVKDRGVLFCKAFDTLGSKVRMCNDTSCRKSCDTLTRIDLDIRSERSKNILSLLYCPPPAQTVSSLVKGMMLVKLV